MIEISVIREEKERLIEGLKKKNVSEQQLASIDHIIIADDKRKATQTNLDNLLFKMNTLSNEIGDLFKSGKANEANDLKEQVASLKEESKVLDLALKVSKDLLEELIIQLPKICLIWVTAHYVTGK